MEKHDRVLSVEKKTDNRFLNMYDIQYENKVGGQGIYHIASRASSIDTLKMNTQVNRPDGVIIYALYGPRRDKVVMVRQYRFSIDDYVYEFPAGLVDAGETYAEAGARELKEETGLDFTPVKANEMFSKPLFTTIGMTDESCSTVYGYASGNISKAGLEDNEDLEVVLADRKEVHRILLEEHVSINCGYLLMHFLCHTAEDPFYFLR